MNLFNPKFKMIDLEFDLFQVGFFCIIVLMNLVVSSFIEKSNIFFVSNSHPFGLDISEFGLAAILIFVSWGLFKFKFISKFPIYSIFILAGILSNTIERLFHGYAIDYINLGVSYANLADLEIWAGAIAINIFAWLPKKNDENRIHHKNLGL